MQPGVKLYVDISRLGTVPDDLKDIKKKVEGYHREYEERIHQLCASRYGPQLDTARMREIQDDLDRIERGVDTLQKTLDEIVKCYAACEKKARERGAIGNLDKGIPQSERVLKNAVDVYGKILDRGELFAQGFWDEIFAQGSGIAEGFGTIFAKLFYCIPGSDNLSKLFGFDRKAIEKWTDGNIEEYKEGLIMLVRHPVLAVSGMLEEWKKTYEEKGPAYIGGKLGFDGFMAMLGSAGAAKAAEGVGNAAQKMDKVVDVGKTGNSVKRKLENAADLVKQTEKATKIRKKVKDATRHATDSDAPGFSSRMQRDVEFRKDFVEYALEMTDGEDENSYGKSIEISEEKMYQQGQHYNKHGRDMGYSSKKEYGQAARCFFEQNKNTSEIYEGIWNNSRGGQSGQRQIILRKDGKQLIINKESGQIIDFYEGTSLDGFINIERVQ